MRLPTAGPSIWSGSAARSKSWPPSIAQLAELVDLKFFCGFSLVEIAGMRGVSERTVRRDWTKARTLLHQSLEEV